VQAIGFLNGLQKIGNEPISKHKRWLDTRGIQAPNAVYQPETNSPNSPNIGSEHNDEIAGDFLNKEEKDSQSSSEKEKSRIVWNCTRRCYLSQTATNA
jgi:hypothetical protein